jgi:hypothetical protein
MNFNFFFMNLRIFFYESENVLMNLRIVQSISGTFVV